MGGTPEYERVYAQINIEKSSGTDLYLESEYHQMDTADYMRNCTIKDQSIYVIEGVHKEVIDFRTSSRYPLNIPDQELVLGGLINIPRSNFVDNVMIVNGYKDYETKMYGISDSVYEITSDFAGAIQVAHGKIYYISDNMYCRINPDGSGWEQLQ